jgi:hypothetical protein
VAYLIDLACCIVMLRAFIAFTAFTSRDSRLLIIYKPSAHPHTIAEIRNIAAKLTQLGFKNFR